MLNLVFIEKRRCNAKRQRTNVLVIIAKAHLLESHSFCILGYFFIIELKKRIVIMYKQSTKKSANLCESRLINVAFWKIEFDRFNSNIFDRERCVIRMILIHLGSSFSYFG